MNGFPGSAPERPGEASARPRREFRTMSLFAAPGANRLALLAWVRER